MQRKFLALKYYIFRWRYFECFTMALYYLQNQLILHIKECKYLKKYYSSNRQKRMVASFSISAILTAKFELEIGMFLCDNHFQWFKRCQYFNFENKFLKNENEGTFSLWVFLNLEKQLSDKKGKPYILIAFCLWQSLKKEKKCQEQI